MSYQWLYKDSLENAVMVLLEDVDSYKEDGWLDPADLGKEVAVKEDVSDLEAMSKEDLELYAREMFDVELDRRKSLTKLVAQVKALEDK